MIYELQYTSAPRGLLPGSSGYSTVKATAGLPPPLRTVLESLSVYRRVFPPGHSQAGLSPVAWSHTRVNVAGRAWHVLSRTCDAGFDHTHRSNYFTHHIAISADSLPQGGPAWLLSQSGLLATAWDGTVGEPASAVRLPSGNDPARVCGRWKELTGDAGWAGAVASHLARRSGPVVVAFSLGTDLLSLFAQAMALLPGSSRWDITFTTYYQGASGSEPYRLRGVLSGSPEHKEATRLPQALVIDLESPLGEPPADELVEVARTGRRVSAAASVTFESVPDDQPDEGGTSYGLQSRAKNTAEEPASAQRPPPMTSHLPMPSPSSGGSIPWPVSFGGGLVSGIVATVCIALALSLTEPREPINTPVTKAAPPAKADQSNGVAPTGKVSEESDDVKREPTETKSPVVLANETEKPAGGKADDPLQPKKGDVAESVAVNDDSKPLEDANQKLNRENKQLQSEIKQLKQAAQERKRQDEENRRQADQRAASKAEQLRKLAELVEVDEDEYVVFTQGSNLTDLKLDTSDWPDEATGTVDLLGHPDDHHWEVINGQSRALFSPQKKKLLTVVPDLASPMPFPRKWRLLVEPKLDPTETRLLRRTILVFHPSPGTTRRIALREKPVVVPANSNSPLILSREKPQCVYPLNERLGKDKQLDAESNVVLLRDVQIEVLSHGQRDREYELRIPKVEWQLVPNNGDLQFTLPLPDRGDPLADADPSTIFRIRGFRVLLIVKDVLVDVHWYRDNHPPSPPKNSKPTGPKTKE